MISLSGQTLMIDFQNWSYTNELIHIPTKGAEFTWNNRISGHRHTKRRLDRTICNQMWIDSCSTLSCTTLVNTCSISHPILDYIYIIKKKFEIYDDIFEPKEK